jgi:hypothetical protein
LVVEDNGYHVNTDLGNRIGIAAMCGRIIATVCGWRGCQHRKGVKAEMAVVPVV